jgi:uroporphyrinogen decarboxylase
MTSLQREVPDRIPWALWGHFPAVPFLKYYSWEKANRDGEESARAHMALLRALDYKMDLLKVTPYYRFMACQWGSKFNWKDNDESPSTIEVVVKETEDWEKLWVLDPRKELREALRCVEILARDLYGLPFIYTIPSPIVQALHGVSEPGRVYEDMKEQPSALKEGLETITQTTIGFAKECIAEGAAGVFFGIGGGGDIWSRMTKEQLEEYALFFDKKILNAVRDAPIKILHICSAKGENPQKHGGYMDGGWFKNYPVDAINWYDSSFTPLEKAKKIYGDKFCLVGGVDHRQTMLRGTSQQVEAAVKDAIERVGQKGGIIIGPGCTLNAETPLANFNAVARAVEKFGVYKK